MRFISGLQFRFRLLPFLATLVVMAIGLSLGQWQMRRADQKRAIEVKLEVRAKAPVLVAGALGDEAWDGMVIDEFRRISLQGQFLAGWPVYLDNRPNQGRAGLYVLMPFRLAGGTRVVMVERGWIARDPRDRTRVPALTTPPGEIVIEGLLRAAPGHVMQLGQAPQLQPGAIVQNLNLADFARSSGLPVQPWLVDQTSDTADRLLREWPRPSSGIERHLGYAFQWYALTAMAGVFFCVTGFRRGRSASS